MAHLDLGRAPCACRVLIILTYDPFARDLGRRPMLYMVLNTSTRCRNRSESHWIVRSRLPYRLPTLAVFQLVNTMQYVCGMLALI